MFSDADEVCEIVDVAKVFVIGERMKDIAFDSEIGDVVEKKEKKPSKKLKLHHRFVSPKLSVLSVRGLC